MRESSGGARFDAGEMVDRHLRRAFSCCSWSRSAGSTRGRTTAGSGCRPTPCCTGSSSGRSFTYNFLQDTAGYTGGVFMLIFNLLGLYFFGGGVRELIGPRRFAWLYAGIHRDGRAGVVRRLRAPGGLAAVRAPGDAVGRVRPVLLLSRRRADDIPRVLHRPGDDEAEVLLLVLGRPQRHRLPVLRDDGAALPPLERACRRPRRDARGLRLLPGGRPGRSVRRFSPAGIMLPRWLRRRRKPPTPPASR